jgi:hypothetical protein
MLKNLFVSLTIVTLVGATLGAVHTTNEGHHPCNLINDLVDEENYSLLREAVKCEIEHNPLC